MGYAKEFHVERYLREAMIARLAPVSLTPHMRLQLGQCPVQRLETVVGGSFRPDHRAP